MARYPKILVVAGTHRQYLDWCHSKHKHPTQECRFISRPEDILGIYDAQVELTGTFSETQIFRDWEAWKRILQLRGTFEKESKDG